MGWSATNRPRHIGKLDFLLHHSDAYSWDKHNAKPDATHTYRVIDARMVGTVAYVAVERCQRVVPCTREVFACVSLIDSRRIGGHNFCHKDMDESMGPCEAKAPRVILDLLTATDSANAINWRMRCAQYHVKRAADARARKRVAAERLRGSYAAEVLADDSGTWARNGLRFATDAEATAYGSDLAGRWTLVRQWRAAHTADRITHAWRDGALIDMRVSAPQSVTS